MIQGGIAHALQHQVAVDVAVLERPHAEQARLEGLVGGPHVERGGGHRQLGQRGRRQPVGGIELLQHAAVVEVHRRGGDHGAAVFQRAQRLPVGMGGEAEGQGEGNSRGRQAGACEAALECAGCGLQE